MIQIIPLRKIPLIRCGDDIADHIVGAAKEEAIEISSRDIIVIAQKIVYKAEGGVVDLNAAKPSTRAEEIAKTSGKDPRHIETILK